jgi:hypothetical protein
MRAISFLLFCFLLLCIAAPPVSAQGFPCVIRGVVTVNGIPTQGVAVTVSSDSHDTTNSTGWYGVDAPSGANVTVTAAYKGYRQAITVETPPNGGFVDGRDIAIENVPVEQAATAVPGDLLLSAAGAAGVVVLAAGTYVLWIRK